MDRIRTLCFASFITVLACLQMAHAASPTLGAAAPEFRLQDQNGKWHQLKDYRGKWLALYFYAKDESPTCTAQANDFLDRVADFKQANAVIVGISVDDVESHKKFADKQKLSYPILADPTKATAKRFDVVNFTGFARRETFLIDPQGVIVKRYIVADPKGHAHGVLKDIAGFQEKK